jgi:hypothetical protein
LLSTSLTGTKASWFKDLMMPVLRFGRVLVAVAKIFRLALFFSRDTGVGALLFLFGVPGVFVPTALFLQVLSLVTVSG